MIKITDMALSLTADAEELKHQAAGRLSVSISDIQEMQILRKSVDARKKNDVHFNYTVGVSLKSGEEGVLSRCGGTKISRMQAYRYELPPCRQLKKRPVLVGAGPAGLFAALILAQAGQRPLLIERGADVDTRAQQVQSFWSG